MGTYRKRFNEKARAGMVAKQEKLRRARQKSFNVENEDNVDHNDKEEVEEQEFNPNAEILQPMTKEEKLEKKRKLEESLRPKEETKMSRTKRKRLEKYIVCTGLEYLFFLIVFRLLIVFFFDIIFL